MTRCTGAVVAVVAMVAGAHSQETAPPVSAEPTAFREVTAKLDPGGSLLVYLSTAQWTAHLGDRVRELREGIEAMVGDPSPDWALARQGFAMVENLTRRSGVESVAGVGLSGIAIEPGLYRTRFVIQRSGEAREGYLWRFFGTAPHALGGLDWLPADTAYAVFGDVDLQGIWEAVTRESQAAGFAPLREAMAGFSAGVAEATGRSFEDHLASHGGEVGLALLLDPSRRIQVPLPGGQTYELPEPSLLLALKVKDDVLYDWTDKMMREHPDSTAGSAPGARWRSVPVPEELPFPVRITVGRAGDYLWYASHDRAFERAMRAQAEGGAAGLRGTAEFQRLSRGLPERGNSFAFVSQRFMETIWGLQEAALRQGTGEAEAKVMTAWLKRWMGLAGGAATYAVGISDADGMQSISQGTQEPATALMTSVAVVPAAMLTGITLPALSQAKNKAQQINCLNNLKQIGLALRIYALDHDDRFPPDFQSLQEELGNPRVLVCPEDPAGMPDRGTPWAGFDFNRVSYEFLKPGIAETDEPPDTPVVRCRFHGSVTLLDGSVIQAPR